MLPGMSVTASLKLATGRRGVAVPRDAIIRFPDGRVVVWVVESGADGPTAREQPVSTGLAFDSMVEIRHGLDAGAVVVTRGNEALQNGQRISLVGS
jgi:multidrug efflux pump subunit AcrA (membrane-fusion protein)